MEKENEPIDAVYRETSSNQDGAVVSPPNEVRPRGVLIRSVVTVVLLVGLPLFGLISLWTISPWSRRARIVLTVVFAVPAIYYPVLVMSALVKAAL